RALHRVCSCMLRRPPRSPHFSYTTLFRSGVGNVGYTTAKLLAERGCKVIAVSDSNGACYNDDGIELDEVVREKELNGRLRQKVRSEEHTSELQSPDHIVCRLLLEKKKQLD